MTTFPHNTFPVRLPGLPNVTTVGNIGTGEDDLMSYTLPANTLINNGDVIKFRMVFRKNASATVRAYFGGTAAAYSMFADLTVEPLLMTVTRLTSTIAEVTVENYDSANGFAANTFEKTGLDFTGTIVVKATGQGTSNDDVQQLHLSGWYYPAQ